MSIGVFSIVYLSRGMRELQWLRAGLLKTIRQKFVRLEASLGGHKTVLSTWGVIEFVWLWYWHVSICWLMHVMGTLWPDPVFCWQTCIKLDFRSHQCLFFPAWSEHKFLWSLRLKFLQHGIDRDIHVLLSTQPSCLTIWKGFGSVIHISDLEVPQTAMDISPQS